MSGSTIVSQGSVASGLNIESGGTVFVGGTLENSIIEDYTTVVGLSGSTFINNTLDVAGNQILDSGAYASGTHIVGEYSSQTISIGATAVNDYIDVSDVELDNLGTLINAVDVAGAITVESGGLTNGTQLSQGSRAQFSGSEGIYSSAVANNSTLNSGGQQIVYNGGYADHTVINMEGENGAYDGTEQYTTINSGGSDVVYGYAGVYGTALSTTINLGGIQTVRSFGISSLAVVAGFLTAQSGGEVSAPIIEGGTIVIETGATLVNGATFDGTGGTLELTGASVNFSITGLESGGVGGDVIDLSGINFIFFRIDNAWL